MGQNSQAASTYANTGYGPQFSILDIGLPEKVAVVEPSNAFWALIDKDAIEEALSGSLVEEFYNQENEFQNEMKHLRFGLTPSAAYLNPTEQCNFNCSYCYLPEDMRRNGKTMTKDELFGALDQLSEYFGKTMANGSKPQIIFHGSEPMIAKSPMFASIEKYGEKFQFGIQTNATLLDDESISFLKSNNVGIGISLDGPNAEIGNNARKDWRGVGAFDHLVKTLDKLSDYPAFNVITTVTSKNVHILPEMVDFYHNHGVKIVMLNPVRCTREGGHQLKPDNKEIAKYFCKALDRSYELYEQTGQKLVIANFANVLASIVAPTGRRLMCDISPCGGGRCFFAVSAEGDVFPCSEFIGLSKFKGGNLYQDDIDNIIKSDPFKAVTTRKIENISPCSNCAIRHFCGAPCPAEIEAVSGKLDAPSPYCEFYEEQVRYAMRVIAHGRVDNYMWDGWQEETEPAFNWPH